MPASVIYRRTVSAETSISIRSLISANVSQAS
jgi:hypothetical protein